MNKPSYSYDKQQENFASAQPVKPTFGDSKPAAETPTNAYIIDDPKDRGTQDKVSSAITIAVGGAVALVGVPMLILPGPGLLAIGGGMALMAKGAKGLFGNKK